MDGATGGWRRGDRVRAATEPGQQVVAPETGTREDPRPRAPAGLRTISARYAAAGCRQRSSDCRWRPLVAPRRHWAALDHAVALDRAALRTSAFDPKPRPRPAAH